jgi:hypothetical protein
VGFYDRLTDERSLARFRGALQHFVATGNFVDDLLGEEP